MLKPKTHVVIVLDRSSSMSTIKDEAIAGFNEQVALFEDKAKDHRLRVGLVTFASEVDKPTVWNKMPSAIKPLTSEDYQPGGMTAFYDGLDLAITQLSQIPEIKDKTSSVLVIAITDGQENASKITGPALASKIKELEGAGNWTFTVMGANINLSQLSDNLGIDIGNTMVFNNTSEGTIAANASTKMSLDSYFGGRKKGKLRSASFYSDPLLNKEDDSEDLVLGVSESLSSTNIPVDDVSNA